MTWSLTAMRYGRQWREHRRAFHQHFHVNVVGRYHTLQEKGARKLALHLLDEPKEFLRLFR
jgi:hypothetical protein